MKKFIFRGWYYPVLGSACGWENYNTKQITERRFMGWENADRWYSFSYGIKVHLTDPTKPYRQFVFDAIENHPDMVIKSEYFDENGTEIKPTTGASLPKGAFRMESVYTKKGKHIGSIRDAYDITNLNDLQGEGTQICAGWSVEDQKYYGWSHRAICGFGVGDKIFNENYGDDTTIYREHGEKEIVSYLDARQSALNFARYVS